MSERAFRFAIPTALALQVAIACGGTTTGSGVGSSSSSGTGGRTAIPDGGGGESSGGRLPSMPSTGGASIGGAGGGVTFEPGCSVAPACGSCQACFDTCFCATQNTTTCVNACAQGAGGSGVPRPPNTGGSLATGGAPQVPLDAGPCIDCFPLDGLYWELNGGYVQYTDTSTLSNCRSYERTRSYVGNRVPIKCAATVVGCPYHGVSYIAALFADPVVQAALKNHMLYGIDSRPTDIPVFRFGIGNDYVDVGGLCNGVDPCVDVPKAISDLIDWLNKLDNLELALEPCRTVFAPTPL